MTVREMVYEFQRLLETMSIEFEGPEKLDTDTMLRFLNWAYDRYIKEKYLSGRTFIENIYNIINNVNDLSRLIETFNDALYGGATYDSLKFFTLPSDYVYYVRADVNIHRDGGPLDTDPIGTNDVWIPAQAIEFSQIDELLTTDINKPIIEKPAVYIVNSGRGHVIIDSYTIANEIQLTYLRKPKELAFKNEFGEEMECELAGYLHEEIVKLAVEIYMMDYKLRLSQKDTGGNG